MQRRVQLNKEDIDFLVEALVKAREAWEVSADYNTPLYRIARSRESLRRSRRCRELTKKLERIKGK